MKKIALIIVALSLILTVANADLTFLAQFGKGYSSEALDAASEATLPDGIHAGELTQFERELFELGFAAGYDARYVDMQKKEPESRTYIVNISTKRFHLPDCRMAQDILEKNKKEYIGTRDELIEQGYKPCSGCDP